MRTLLLALLAFTLLPACLAIGISPPQGKIDFVPGKTYEFSVTILNGNDFPITTLVRTEGEFKDNIVAKPVKVSASSSNVAPIRITLPDALDRPGYHTSYIYFTEQYVDKNAGTFQVRTEVGFKLTVWQPYPGKYAEIIASAPSVSEGEDTVLKARVTNFGTDDIEGKATVRVLSPIGELKDVLAFPDVKVAGNSYQEYVDVIPASGYEPGKYTLAARLEYGENVSVMNSTFIVGTQDVEIVALEGPFYLDKPVNKFNLHVQSLWNLPLDNVYATVELGSGKSTTPSTSLGAFSQAAFEGYWETDKTVQPGEVLATATVYFPGGKKEALVPVQVYNETPKPPTLEEPSAIELSGADLIFICLAIIIVISLVLFAFHRHMRVPPQQPPHP